MTINAKAASPAKLSDGSWGARVADPIVGDVVRVRTSGGKEWDARVVAILTVGYGGSPSLCRTASMDRAPVAAPSSREERLLDRGLVEVNGPRGTYVRKMTKSDWHDEI